MSRTMAMASLEATMDDKGLPVKRTNMINGSDYVLVRVKGLEDFRIGIYLHGIQKWYVRHEDSELEVIEWWPLPKEGTGVKVEV